jgi:hypothetical protein
VGYGILTVGKRALAAYNKTYTEHCDCAGIYISQILRDSWYFPFIVVMLNRELNKMLENLDGLRRLLHWPIPSWGDSVPTSRVRICEISFRRL